MKKILSLTLVLIIIYLIFQFVTNLLKTSHDINYTFEKDKKKYYINEKYIKSNNEDYYLLTIKLEDKYFVFDVDNSFNKQKNILEDIYLYEKDNLICMYPIYKDNKTSGKTLCNVDGKLYTDDSIKTTYNIDEFIKTLPNYNNKTEESSPVARNYNDLKIYYENLYEDEIITIYNYKSIIKMTKRENNNIEFSNKDVYKNELGVQIDKYYLVPNYDDNGYYKSFKVLNILDKSIEEITFKEPTSSNIYINGVVDGILYFFDKNNLKEYMIDPKNKTYEIIGDETKKGKAYIDGNWMEKTVYELNQQNILFSKEYSKTNSSNSTLFESGKYYYFYNSNGVLYKSYIMEPSKEIEVFKDNNISEIKVVGDYIYYIKNNTIYRYNFGISIPLIERKEFQYNKLNIYDIYITK